ncbi:TetR/AcrR family transcriptional regulator [Marinimicrobium alkaliphilum]|uniref:TetR/AcrR family transcriptional regulator n=1 Tax=Marinimicrobium alkaliphilum TaxID=2202654 RepID=UPI000DB9DC6D|nr:TetR/AcrR family transcriptional regulator [Marinimicrobium alkaliphilum]
MTELKPKRVHKPADQRRSEILAAACRVFAEQGYQRADMQAVADAAGVGKGTVYRHLASKEELFSAVLDDCLERLMQAIAEGVESREDPIEQLRELMRAYLLFFENNPEVIELLAEERIAFPDRKASSYFARAPEGREEIGLPLFERLAQTCELRDFALEDIMDAGADLIHGAVFLQCSPHRTKPLSERFDTLFEIFMQGILKPPH